MNNAHRETHKVESRNKPLGAALFVHGEGIRQVEVDERESKNARREMELRVSRGVLGILSYTWCSIHASQIVQHHRPSIVGPSLKKTNSIYYSEFWKAFLLIIKGPRWRVTHPHTPTVPATPTPLYIIYCVCMYVYIYLWECVDHSWKSRIAVEKGGKRTLHKKEGLKAGESGKKVVCPALTIYNLSP